MSHWWYLYLRMLGKGLLLKTTTLLVLFLWLSKVFEKPVNNTTVDHLEKCDLFSDFWYVLGLLNQQQVFTVVSDRIARPFNRAGATRAVAFDWSKGLNRFQHAGLLYKLKSYRISHQIFGLISSFLSNRWLWVVLDGKSAQEYPSKCDYTSDLWQQIELGSELESDLRNTAN